MSNEKKTRKEQAQETKQRIFDVALKMLDEKSFDEITIRDIVKAAGVSTGTFYLYYETKMDVYYETYVLADKYFNTTVRRAVSKIENSSEKIVKFFSYYAKYSSDITSLALTKVLYNSDNKYFKRKSEKGMGRLLFEIISEAKENGTIKTSENAESICHFFMLCARGQAYDWCISDGSYKLSSEMEKTISKLLEAYC